MYTILCNRTFHSFTKSNRILLWCIAQTGAVYSQEIRTPIYVTSTSIYSISPSQIVSFSQSNISSSIQTLVKTSFEFALSSRTLKLNCGMIVLSSGTETLNFSSPCSKRVIMLVWYTMRTSVYCPRWISLEARVLNYCVLGSH